MQLANRELDLTSNRQQDHLLPLRDRANLQRQWEPATCQTPQLSRPDQGMVALPSRLRRRHGKELEHGLLFGGHGEEGQDRLELDLCGTPLILSDARGKTDQDVALAQVGQDLVSVTHA